MAPSSWSSLRACFLAAVVAFSPNVSAYVANAVVSTTILVLARDQLSATNGVIPGLQGYGIPYELITVPYEGIPNLPLLNSSATHGNYGGIVMLSEVGYLYPEDGNAFHTALTRRQLNQLWDYQTQFGVRMVRLDVFPTTDFGVEAAGAGSTKDEPVTFTNITAFQTSGIRMNANVSIANIFHNPAKIINSTMAWEVAKFGTAGTAAVINQIGARQQMVWFMPFALDWAAASNFIQHSWITWLTRGLYVGFRRLYFSTQVDDMFLQTPLYRPQGQNYRAKPDDMDMHVTWQTDLNKRLPKGSEYFVEIGHNGNGDIEAATDTTSGETLCKPATGIDYPDQKDGSPEYTKPPGTGTNIWPATPEKYTWSLQCAELDELQNWFAETRNRDAFAHLSHTFSHADLTNATYSDAAKEIQFNKAWLKQVGFESAKWFSGKGLIPPAITGLHNADVIKAWMDNGITNVVGDNTRPRLKNTQSSFWPLNTTVEGNGYPGLNVMPRFATLIYYNCDLPACTLQEWIDTSAGKGTFNDLIVNDRDRAMRNLFGLHWDAYMFHQANMRVNDVPNTIINGKRGQYSLLMTWTEIIVQEIMRLTTWPLKTLKHDDLAQAFINRRVRDLCRPSMTFQISADGKGIDNVNVYTAGGNRCNTPIPITVPVATTANTGATKEQIGTDPLTLWVTMSGASRNYKFSKAIPL